MKKYKYLDRSRLLFLLMVCLPLYGQEGKEATFFTRQVNQAEYERLDFVDLIDHEEATRGFIATLDEDILYNSKGEVATHLNSFDFIKGEAPATVNPALWRHAGLNTIRGLFEVTEGVWQVRGFDLTNITFIKSDNGFLVIDPLTNANATQAAYKLVKKTAG
ncbi:MAG: hypothetical protein LUE93_00505 [Bacteroides sp.]|nr:hypothetical protein [Bacteroides sp.]